MQTLHQTLHQVEQTKEQAIKMLASLTDSREATIAEGRKVLAGLEKILNAQEDDIEALRAFIGEPVVAEPEQQQLEQPVIDGEKEAA